MSITAQHSTTQHSTSPHRATQHCTSGLLQSSMELQREATGHLHSSCTCGGCMELLEVSIFFHSVWWVVLVEVVLCR